jgi:hypothetical protein
MTMRHSLIAWSLLCAFLCAGVVAADDGKFVPPPLRIHVPFEKAWDAMHDAFQARDLRLLSENRGQGFMLSEFTEYTSGPLTENYLAKIGEKPKLADAYWIRAEYQYDIRIELIEAKETVVTVDAKIKALKRDFLGKETWVPIPSNGQREESLLTEFGRLLFGETFQLDKPKKGMWEREPAYVPDMSKGGGPSNHPERP